MSTFCVKADRICKKFFIPARANTTLNAIKTLLRKQALGKDLWALREISFEIRSGEKIAIIGPNGSGKTTLLRIVSGIYLPTSGNIVVEGAPRPLFNIASGLSNDLSVVDNIDLFGAVHGLARTFIEEHIDSILKDAGLGDVRFTLMKDLSRGQRQRLALSTFFQVNDKFLIFDESLTYVDQSFSSRCESYFEQLVHSSRTVIMVSHDIDFLSKYCSRALWIDKGEIRMHGEIGAVIQEYRRGQCPG
ncbi:MAG: ATP-binding cassette domain-containing protein [Candidatus Omnitrophota bacterium]|nr:ATP-binding cassette domain-containing protein [Candidatus Omnitrophota bacterium]